MPESPVPKVTPVVIRDRNIVHKITGEILIRATNNSVWRAMQNNIRMIVESHKDKGEAYLVTWVSEHQKDIPAGTEMGKVTAHRSNRTHVLGAKGGELGLLYDLSLGHNHTKFVFISGDEDVPF